MLSICGFALLPLVALSSPDDLEIAGTFRMLYVSLYPVECFFVDNGGSEGLHVRWVADFQLRSFF